jgi:type I restriction enzyme S subunit
MPRDLDPEGINWDRCARIGDDDVNRLTRHILEPGDIVQSRRGDLTRRAVVAAGSERALCGTGCFVIRLKDEGLAPFVAAALSEPTVAYAIEQASAGVTMPNLNGKTLASVRIPLPDERSRGALLVAVSQSREASQLIDAGVAETRADLVRLRASVLHRAFTGDLLGTSVSEIAGAAA